LFWLILALALVTRILMTVNHPQGWDSVDFALGVEKYDLLSMQPHFPGYPVYILIGKGFNSLTGDPLLSLSLAGAVFGALTIIPFYGIARILLGRDFGLWVALALAVSPLHWLLSEQAMSDGVGNFFVVSFVYLALKGLKAVTDRWKLIYLSLGALVLALGLGVRLSYFPYAVVLIGVVLLWTRQNRVLGLKAFGTSLAAGLLGVGIWLSWQVSYDGVKGLWDIAITFTKGHFVDWGGTIVTTGGPLERVNKFLIHNLLGAGLGIYLPGDPWWRIGGTLFLLGGGIGLGIRSRKGWETILKTPEGLLFGLWLIPYTIWVYFGQNAEKPRHIVTLVPPVIILLGYGWKSLLANAKPYRQQLVLVLLLLSIAVMGWTGWELVKNHREQPSPMYKLARYLGEKYQDPQSVIFTWEEERVIKYYYKDFNTFRLRKWEDFIMTIQGLPWTPDHILLTSTLVKGLDENHRNQLLRFLEPRAKFAGNPHVYPTYNEIVLYEAKPEFYLWALRRQPGT